MRVMVFVKATEDSEKGVPPTTEAFAAMDRFTEELVKAGIMVAGAGLKNTAEAKRIAFDGPEPHGHRRAVRRDPRAGRRLLDLAGQGHGRGRGLGEALPQSHVGPERDRDPAVLRGGGSGRVSDARGAIDAPRRASAGSSASPKS